MMTLAEYDDDKATKLLPELVKISWLMAHHDSLRQQQERDIWFDFAHAHCEISELFNELKHRNLQPSRDQMTFQHDKKVVAELADVLNMILILSAQLGVTPDRVIETALNKFSIKMLERGERLIQCEPCEECWFVGLKVGMKE